MKMESSNLDLDTVIDDDLDRISVDYSAHSDALNDENSQELLKKADDIKLNGKESIFLAAALEDSLIELFILRSCNKKIKANKVEEPKLIKFGNIVAKMNSDREFVSRTIIKLYLDLKFNQKYATLNIQLADIAGKAYQSIAQELRYNDNRRRLKKLRSHRNKEMQINKSLLFNCDLQIYNLRDEIDNDLWNCAAKRRYVEANQCAKYEEHTAKVNQKETLSNDSIFYVKNKIDDEIRINIEIEYFTRQSIEEIHDKIAQWTIKYRDESAQLSSVTMELEEMRAMQMQKMIALQRTVEEHRVEMEAWKAVVASRTQRLERERLLQTSAVKLQAWWRGLLVRRRLAAKRAKETKKKSAKKTK